MHSSPDYRTSHQADPRAGAAVLLALTLAAACSGSAAERKLRAVIVDGVNNHDWAAGTIAIKTILEGTGRFTVDVATYPKLPDFARYDVAIDNFNGGHTETGTRWPAGAERALEAYLRGGGGMVVFHAANNAFLKWPEYNQMIGLGWRDQSFGPGIAIGPNGQVITIPKGEGLPPGHGPRHDFDVFVLDKDHPITRGLPAHWLHPSEQLTHGQHGPAEGLTILTYAFSEVSRQGEPMDWIRGYGRGRIYTTMLGHTWKNEPNPNLDDVTFQALLARGVEWAASGKVTLPPDLGWRPLFNGKNLDGWEVRGPGVWTVMQDGVLMGQRAHPQPAAPFSAPQSATPWPVDEKHYRDWLYRQAWLYTKAEFGEFDLHLEYWIPPGANSGVSIRDRSRAHSAIGEPDSERPELASFQKTTPAHIGYEIQIIDDEGEKFGSGSVYTFVPAKTGLQRRGEWNSLEIESRHDLIRVRINGQIAAEYPGDPARSKSGPIGLQLHDQFTLALFRNMRIRQRAAPISSVR
jgi:type 1 glutamine amidotransferase